MQFTPFESEILDSVVWQAEGFRIGRVTRRATTRILRATLRRIRPRLIARSVQAGQESDIEADHAIPVHIICDRILCTDDLDRHGLIKILSEWLVSVELTRSEHRDILREFGLQSRMPTDWDGSDPLARYKSAGIDLARLEMGAV